LEEWEKENVQYSPVVSNNKKPSIAANPIVQYMKKSEIEKLLKETERKMKKAAKAENLRRGSKTARRKGKREAQKASQKADSSHRVGAKELASTAAFEGAAEFVGNLIPDDKHIRACSNPDDHCN